MSNVDALLHEKMKILKNMSFDVSIISMNGLGTTDFDDKKIYINDSLALIAKQYIFFHEFFHVLSYNKGTQAKYNAFKVEDVDIEAVKLLIKSDFNFDELFIFPPFKKLEEIHRKYSK